MSSMCKEQEVQGNTKVPITMFKANKEDNQVLSNDKVCGNRAVQEQPMDQYGSRYQTRVNWIVLSA